MARLLILALLGIGWFIAVMMTARSTVQREMRVRNGLDTRPSTSEGFGWSALAYGLSALWGFVLGDVLIHMVLNSTQGLRASFPKFMTFMGLWVTFVAIQLVTNYGRHAENLQRAPFLWFPQRPKLPVPPAAQQARDARTEQRFTAMELMPFYWNRYYSVFIADRMLCGAKAQFGALNIAFNPGRVARSISFDPNGYVRASTPAQYYNMDVTGPAFLAADRVNFQIAFTDISSIELKPAEVVKSEAGFGLGGLRQSGALVLSLKSGETRQLILLGDQDGTSLKQRLEDLANGKADTQKWRIGESMDKTRFRG